MSLRLSIALLLVVAAPVGYRSGSTIRLQTSVEPDLAAPLNRVVQVHQQLKDLHPAFARLYPIAVVKDKTFYVYEPDAATGRYKLAATAPDKMNVPDGIRAAMPLDFWGNRIACVVSPDAFDSVKSIILVFHEFVHCYQWDTCEMQLKEKMGLYRSAMERKDYMWELQYKFPYTADTFTQAYGQMLEALSGGDAAAVARIRSHLHATLTTDEWDYMTWQEWKEGTARYLENEAAVKLGQPLNRGGAKPPFSRVTFYAGGEALIRSMAAKEPGLDKDVERVYHRIAGR